MLHPFTLPSYTRTWLSYCKKSIYTIKSYMVVILQTIHLHCQVIIIQGLSYCKQSFTLSSLTWLSYCEQSIYTVKWYSYRVVILRRIHLHFKSYMVVILLTIHLHCQVILLRGCHIANNPFTLPSHTWLSYCEQSINTVKWYSYRVVILQKIHLHCQVILVQGCHIANNPFTLSSHT